VLEDAGVPYQLLEASRLAEVEPALADVAHKLTAGYVYPMTKPVTASFHPAAGENGRTGGRPVPL
jgi:hypothetical protein